MKYVKLTAKPNTWFKNGTEVYDYDSDENNKTRITLDDWNNLVSEVGGIVVFGLRVCEDTPNENGIGYKADDERWDRELCSCDEFNSEIVEEKE